MKNIKTFFTICLLLAVYNSSAQKSVAADSIIRYTQKLDNYNLQIEVLQKKIEEVYVVQFDEALQLAHFGYNLAVQQNDSINTGDFLRSIGGAYGKKGNIDSASVYYFKAKCLSPPKQ